MLDKSNGLWYDNQAVTWRHRTLKIKQHWKKQDPCNSKVSKDTEEMIFLRNKLDLSLKDLGFNTKVLRYNFSRVWSWLRTNAGGAPNTCKSNGDTLFTEWWRCEAKKFERMKKRCASTVEWIECLSGGRVSNAWATCLAVGNNTPKGVLIPHDVTRGHPLITKDLSLWDGLASD